MSVRPGLAIPESYKEGLRLRDPRGHRRKSLTAAGQG